MNIEEIKQYLTGSSTDPLYRQIANAVCLALEAGAEGGKLPPIRKLADALNVNNITVVNAYKLLENRKLAYSITGSGTYISPETANYIPVTEQADFTGGSNAGKEHVTAEEPLPPAYSSVVSFAKGSVSPELFPVDDFKVLFNQVLQRDKGNAFEYEQSQGYLPLRENLCVYLESFGIKASSDKIQIISGAQQGIDIVSKALLFPHDAVLTENPTYYGAVGAFMSRGADVFGVPLEPDGIEMEKLIFLIKTRRPKLVYVMTYYQTPTCVSYSIEKKRALIELAAKYDFYIIEEDNQSDFNYSGQIQGLPIVPLKALDYKNRVIYIKSFSKLLMPGLRLGFMTLPKPVLNKIMSAKHLSDKDTSGFLQRAFSLFIETGGWDRHIALMRGVFGKRYETMVRCLNYGVRKLMPFDEPMGGLNIWCGIPANEPSSIKFAKKLANQGVIVTPGDVFALHDNQTRNIRLSFADIPENKIEESVSRLFAALLLLQKDR